MSLTTRPAGRRGSGPDVARTAVLLMAGGLALTGSAWAQSLSIVPNLSITETLTDNRDLRSSNPHSDLITQISPGVSISARRGALQGALSYAANGVVYVKDSSLNNVYHTLSGTGNLALLEGQGGITATTSASRQVISAFGTQGVDSSLNNANQAQVFSYSLTPYLTGKLLGDVSYQARLGYTASQSDSELGDTTSLTANVGLGGRRGLVGWGLDASRVISKFSGRSSNTNTRLTGSLSYTPDIEWQMSLRGGSETDDLQTGRSERTTTWGLGVNWTPGPRTTARLDYDRRFFGRSHSFGFSHRMANTIWTANDGRSLELGGTSGRGITSNYDQFFAQFASIEPDAAKRDVLVRALLAAANLDPNGREVVGGFLTSSPTVSRTQNVSMAYQGVRATFTVSLFRTQSRRATDVGRTGDDLANAPDVRQRGLSVSLSHRLTPDASVIVSVSQQRTPTSGAQAGNELRSITATWSSRLGPYANVSLGLRHTAFDSDLNPYHESALIGSVRMQF